MVAVFFLLIFVLHKQTLNAMKNTKKEKETALLKLATIGKAAKALAMAADTNGLTPEEISGIVIALAKKELQ